MSLKWHPSGQNTDTKVTFFANIITPKTKAFPQKPHLKPKNRDLKHPAKKKHQKYAKTLTQK